MSDTPNIEKGIPIPGKTTFGRPPHLRRRLESMEVGDSFIALKSRRPGIYSAAKKSGVKITTRLVGKTRVRCWRIE